MPVTVAPSTRVCVSVFSFFLFFLQAMKHDFLQRKISRKNIKQIAETHNLCVKIRTDGDKNIIVYGNEKAAGSQLVQLAIIKGVVDHYIHF